MALIKCPECGKEISDKAKACPNCGVPVSSTTVDYNSKSKTGNVLIIWAIVCLIVCTVYGVRESSNELGERAYYLMNGYYRDPSFMLQYNIITYGLTVIGWIFFIVGVIIKIVYRKRK